MEITKNNKCGSKLCFQEIYFWQLHSRNALRWRQMCARIKWQQILRSPGLHGLLYKAILQILNALKLRRLSKFLQNLQFPNLLSGEWTKTGDAQEDYLMHQSATESASRIHVVTPKLHLHIRLALTSMTLFRAVNSNWCELRFQPDPITVVRGFETTAIKAITRFQSHLYIYLLFIYLLLPVYKDMNTNSHLVI